MTTKADFDWRERVGCIIDHAARIRGEGVRRAVVDLLYEYDALPDAPIAPPGGAIAQPAEKAEEAARVQRLAQTFAEEYITGHCDRLHGWQVKKRDELMVILLAFYACAGQPARAALAAPRAPQEPT